MSATACSGVPSGTWVVMVTTYSTMSASRAHVNLAGFRGTRLVRKKINHSERAWLLRSASGEGVLLAERGVGDVDGDRDRAPGPGCRRGCGRGPGGGWAP